MSCGFSVEVFRSSHSIDDVAQRHDATQAWATKLKRAARLPATLSQLANNNATMLHHNCQLHDTME